VLDLDETIFWVKKMTEEGVLVWRQEPNFGLEVYKAYPSDIVENEEDFELRIGRRLGSVVLGIPSSVEPIRLMIKDGCGNPYYCDATDEVWGQPLKDFLDFVQRHKGTGELSPLVPQEGSA